MPIFVWKKEIRWAAFLLVLGVGKQASNFTYPGSMNPVIQWTTDITSVLIRRIKCSFGDVPIRTITIVRTRDAMRVITIKIHDPKVTSVVHCILIHCARETQLRTT